MRHQKRKIPVVDAGAVADVALADQLVIFDGTAVVGEDGLTIDDVENSETVPLAIVDVRFSRSSFVVGRDGGFV